MDTACRAKFCQSACSATDTLLPCILMYLLSLSTWLCSFLTITGFCLVGNVMLRRMSISASCLWLLFSLEVHAAKAVYVTLCLWILSSLGSHAIKAVHVSFLCLTAGSLALAGSRVSCTAGLAAQHLGEAAHMTGTVNPCRQCMPVIISRHAQSSST